jgi:phage baseplate assembly protein W
MALYHGFSTYNRYKKFHLTDFELIQQNLFNHFNIRKGEKLMNPNFGTIIWGMLFEPFTDDVRKAITDDVKRITTYDPRIAVENIQINEFEQGINIRVTITYLVQNKTTTVDMNFDRDSRTLSAGIISGNSNNNA